MECDDCVIDSILARVTHGILYSGITKYSTQYFIQTDGCIALSHIIATFTDARWVQEILEGEGEGEGEGHNCRNSYQMEIFQFETYCNHDL